MKGFTLCEWSAFNVACVLWKNTRHSHDHCSICVHLKRTNGPRNLKKQFLVDPASVQGRLYRTGSATIDTWQDALHMLHIWCLEHAAPHGDDGDSEDDNL